MLPFEIAERSISRGRGDDNMTFSVSVVGGLFGPEEDLGTFNVTPQEIDQACGLYGSTYVLRMGLHYQRYVVSGYLPNWNAVKEIYASANPAPESTTKRRASSVTRNIGESMLPLVARRLLDADKHADIQFLNATSKAKYPDSRIRTTPRIPLLFEKVPGITPRSVSNIGWQKPRQLTSGSR